MKVNVKKRYKELLEHIQFPAFIYYYETNRMLGMNQLASEILGQSVKNIKDITPNNMRPKYSKQLLENGSKILYNQEIYTESGKIQLDIEINVIAVEDIHMCILFFEHSYKNSFGKNLSFELPRMYWKNKDQIFIGMNKSFNTDFNIDSSREEMQNKEIINKAIKNKDIMNIIEEDIIDVDEMRVIKGKESLYDIIQLIKVKNDANLFTITNRLPIFNKNGTVVGLLGTYHLIIDKAVYKNQFYNAIKETHDLYEDQLKLCNFFTTLLRLSQLNKEYSVVLDTMFDALVTYYDIEFINIYGYNQKEKKVEGIYGRGNQIELFLDRITNSSYLRLYHNISKAINKKEVLALIDGREHGKFDFVLEYTNMKALLLFELSIKGYNNVVIFFGDSKDRDWTDEEMGLFREIAQLVQIVFEKHNLKQEIKELQERIDRQ